MGLRSKLLAAFVFVLGCFCFSALLSTTTALKKMGGQLSRMHAMAEHHRIYEPPARWRHDENVLVKIVRNKENDRSLETAGLILCALVFLVVILRGRTRPVLTAQSIGSMRRLGGGADGPLPSFSLPSTDKPFAPAFELAKALRDRDQYDERDEKGKIGHAKVILTVHPLLLQRWEVVAENLPVVFEGGTKRGDIDVLLRSPNGNAYSIDAKNLNNVRVEYRAGAARLDHKVVFMYRYEHPEHQVVKSLEAADWARRQARFAFRPGSSAFALMCFVENPGLRLLERNAYGLRLVKLSSLVTLLQTLDRADDGESAIPADI